MFLKQLCWFSCIFLCRGPGRALSPLHTEKALSPSRSLSLRQRDLPLSPALSQTVLSVSLSLSLSLSLKDGCVHMATSKVDRCNQKGAQVQARAIRKDPLTLPGPLSSPAAGSLMELPMTQQVLEPQVHSTNCKKYIEKHNDSGTKVQHTCVLI